MGYLRLLKINSRNVKNVDFPRIYDKSKKNHNKSNKKIFLIYNMKDFIDALEILPLSDKDLANIAKCLGKNLDTIRIMTYDKLHDFKNLHELFSNTVDSIYILLQRKDTRVGHWVLLMKNIYGYVYFDPYSFSLIEF